MEAARHTRMDEVFAHVARVGPYFAVRTDPAVAGHPLWRPFGELCGAALPGQIGAVRGLLRTTEPRVAASILFQGIAGRLWSPVLAAAAGHRVVPDLNPDDTYWRAASPGPVLLAAPGAGALPGGAGEMDRVINGRFLGPLVSAVGSVTPVAEALLWGNAASALAGALTVLAAARPRQAAAAGRLVEDLLATPPLAGTGTLGPEGFRRYSCCLYYRVPGGGKCGDCALL
jgi:FhuF-like iron-sulfur protein